MSYATIDDILELLERENLCAEEEQRHTQVVAPDRSEEVLDVDEYAVPLVSIG